VRLWLTAFLLSILILAGLNSGPAGIRQSGVFSTGLPTPYTHYFPQGAQRGRVLVIHGLNGNKEMMNLLCLALSDAGFHVYAMDLPGHGDSLVGFNGMLARQAVNRALDALGPGTIAIGHSLGGAALLDLASSRSFGTLVLLSPAPTPVETIHADRLLVLTGQFELPRVQSFVPQLEISGSEGVVLRRIPWSGHSGYLFQPEAIRGIVSWLGGDPEQVHTRRRLSLLLVEVLAALAIAALWLRGSPIVAKQARLPERIVSYIAACTVALLVCGIVVLPNALDLFATDYLLSFILVMGISLAPLYLRKLPHDFSQIPVSLFAAACLIAAAISVGSELMHLTVSAGRWWLFAAITLAVLPLSLADEVLLRPLRPWWKAAGMALLSRVLIAAFVVTGVLTMNRDDGFMVLIIHFIVLLWMALWFAGEFLRRRTQDPLSTAVFTAVIQAWIFAAVFVRT